MIALLIIRIIVKVQIACSEYIRSISFKAIIGKVISPIQENDVLLIGFNTIKALCISESTMVRKMLTEMNDEETRELLALIDSIALDKKGIIKL